MRRLSVPSSQDSSRRCRMLARNTGICSTIAAVSSESFITESDVALKEETVRSIEVPFYDHSELPFKSIQQFPSAVTYPVFDAYELAYPLAGPWDELTTDTIPKEAVEAWIDSLKDNSEAPKPVVCVFTKNFNLVSKIKTFRDYHPVLILLKAPSSSDALKKLYQYEKLIASGRALSDDLFAKLIQKYSGKVHDMGINQCVDENELTKLRKIVHQLLKQKPTEAVAPKAPTEDQEAILIKPAKIQNGTIRKNTSTARSKL